jgi:metal-responsive CopG/Arc/MetJ family transcriptional regulator
VGGAGVSIPKARRRASKFGRGLRNVDGYDMMANMKTIAITVDEETLEQLDRVAGKNRSLVVRKALQEYLRAMDRATEQERERQILHRHRRRLDRQCAALIKDQAHE